MSPAMDVGDVVFISKVPADTIKVGDIVEYRTAEKINIIHRVMAIQETGGTKSFITKGDANDAPDHNPVLLDNVVGKVIFTLPKVGWIAVAVKGFLPQ